MAVLVVMLVSAVMVKAPWANTSAVAFFAAWSRVLEGARCCALAVSTPLEMAVVMGAPWVVWVMASVRIVRTRAVVGVMGVVSLMT